MENTYIEPLILSDEWLAACIISNNRTSGLVFETRWLVTSTFFTLSYENGHLTGRMALDVSGKPASILRDNVHSQVKQELSSLAVLAVHAIDQNWPQITMRMINGEFRGERPESPILEPWFVDGENFVNYSKAPMSAADCALHWPWLVTAGPVSRFDVTITALIEHGRSNSTATLEFGRRLRGPAPVIAASHSANAANLSRRVGCRVTFSTNEK